MKTHFVSRLMVLAMVGGLHLAAAAQEINLQPKYGLVAKTPQQTAADEKFLAAMDKEFVGERAIAAEQVARSGWVFLRNNALDTAIRRFNQAWLLDHANGTALWGMAIVESSRGKLQDARKLMAEAEPKLHDNADFEADYARTLANISVQTRDQAMMADALKRFDKVNQQQPEHGGNLKNWAVLLFYMGDYAGAWDKVQRFEKTPANGALDPKFLTALGSKMARPEANH